MAAETARATGRRYQIDYERLNEPDFTPERPLLTLTLIAFTLMAGLAAADLLSDLREGTTISHVVVEVTILLVGFLGRERTPERHARGADPDARAAGACSHGSHQRWPPGNVPVHGTLVLSRVAYVDNRVYLGHMGAVADGQPRAARVAGQVRN